MTQNKLINNLEASRLIGVSHTTIARWVEDAQAKKNGLQLELDGNKVRIIKNSHNMAEMERLKEANLKYRNKTTYQKISPDPSLYEILTRSQLIELIISLEKENTIPMKFAYLGEGAKFYSNFVKANYKEKNNYYLNTEDRLLFRNLSILVMKIQEFKKVNLIDLGCGNGINIKPAINKLIESGKEVSYFGVDLSKDMLEVAESNLRQVPNLKVKTVQLDFENSSLDELFFEAKLNNPQSINFIILFGSTPGNLQNRIATLKKVRYEMNLGDFLILSNRHDLVELRTDFNTFNDPHALKLFGHIPEKLGLNKENCIPNSIFNENNKNREKYLELTKDLDLVFTIDSFEYNIKLNKGRKIKIIWHYAHTLSSLQDELTEAGFAITHFSIDPEKTSVIALCEPDL